MVRFIMRRGPTLGAIFELNEDVVMIGRGQKNDIVIHDNEVSREHCRLVRVVDDYELEDLNSSNGTFVNGQRVVRNWLLQHGYLVELGDSITLEYERPESESKREETETQEAVSAPPAEAVAHHHALMMTVGPDTGRIYTLINNTTSLGRDLSNDIIIQDPEVSRYHLRIRRTNWGHEVDDLGSTNGTQVNEVPLTGTTQLQEDDVIKLGTSVQLQYIIKTVEAINNDNPTISRRMSIDSTSTHILETNLSILPNAQAQRHKTSSLGTGLEPGALEDHIFLAYARDDWEKFIASLTVNLQDAGLNVWVDQYLTYGGPDWRAAIEQALYECYMMVVVVTPRSAVSNNVKMEYRYFVNRDKPLIPLLYEPTVTMPMELARKKAVVHDRKDPNRSVQRLIDDIEELRKQIR
jgi:pSer/pThr/pTyr-binding forkhead associated (FHA) protein